MKSPDESGPSGKLDRQEPARRSWMAAVAISGAVTAVGVALSATLNPMLGRAVHWDWMAVAAPSVFMLLALALRKRWV